MVGTADLTRKRNPTRSCGCAHLRPLVSATPVGQRTAEIAMPVPRPIERREPRVVWEWPDQPLPALTAEQRLEGWHDSQLGRTRRVCRPVDEDDDAGGVLHDFDPFA